MSAIDEICAYADRKLAGSTLTFAVVVWVKGGEANPASVSLSAPSAFQASAIQALRTTADAAERQAGGLPPVCSCKAFEENCGVPGCAGAFSFDGATS